MRAKEFEEIEVGDKILTPDIFGDRKIEILTVVSIDHDDGSVIVESGSNIYPNEDGQYILFG